MKGFLMNKTVLALLLATTALSSFAQAKKEVTFAHQDMVLPYRIAMESGEIEKATGYKINWRMFGGGGDVIKAMASVTCKWAKSAPAHWLQPPAKGKMSSWSGFWTTSPHRTPWSPATAPTSTDGKISSARKSLCLLCPPPTAR
jgi:ABC-type nitrate/sulfonate/bicarbonate transport system substrate-binding protein